jgi:hypothetical protein
MCVLALTGQLLLFVLVDALQGLSPDKRAEPIYSFQASLAGCRRFVACDRIRFMIGMMWSIPHLVPTNIYHTAW